MSTPLGRVRSIKVKLGLLVAVSVLVAAVLGTVSNLGGVPPWLAIPVTVALALAVTQLLASGMTAPLRQMTEASGRMARGDYAVRIATTATDEVGRLARAFDSMAAELAQVDRQRRELVATVSHELRTPLAGLVAVLENIEDGVTEPRAVGTALRQAERLSALVGDLLDLSRIDAGAAPLRLVDVPVVDLVADVVAETGTLGRDVELDVRVSPLVVRGDRARLHQLLTNLLDNATRHAPTGSHVGVVVSPMGQRWRLEVTNAGAPVVGEDRERAFERFGRLGDDGGGGTGLGLAIARWVAELHGGTVAFTDPVSGSGVRVVADLPVDPTTTGAAMPVATPPPPLPPPAAPPLASPVVRASEVAPTLWPVGSPAGRPRLLLAAVVTGVLASLLVATHDPGLGYAIVLLTGGATVWAATGRRTDRFTLACGTLGAALVLVLVLRDAVWIGTLCVLAATVLCLVGCTRPRGFLGIVLTGVLWPLTALHGLPWLGRTLSALGGRGHAVAVIRTVVVSLTCVVTFGLLFASADALFARWFGALVPTLGPQLVFRIFVGVAVGGLLLCTSYYALNPAAVDAVTPPARPLRRRYEWLVPVLLVDAVFALFLLAQAAATFGGHAYVRRTTGLTYAQYVHQGFGQLTVATALTLLVVSLAARKAARSSGPDRSWLRGSLGVLCLFALVVVASALHRVDLYQQAYGFTRLRLLVDAFEAWLGLLVVAVVVAGIRLAGAWLPRFAVLSGSAVLLALALLNPDARIARHNVERYEATGKVDLVYLQGLSADAVPALLRLPLGDAGCVLVRGPATVGHDDPTEWNLGRVRARAALKDAHPSSAAQCAAITQR